MILELERITRIAKDLRRLIYRNSIPIENYKIKDEAFDTKEWNDYRCGELWGGYDCHSLFSTNIKIPKEFNDKTVVFIVTTGKEGEWDALNPQMLFYLNGELIQGIDVNHREVLISERAVFDEEFHIELLAYSGMHHERIQLRTEICILDREIEDIYYNIKNPLDIAALLDENSEDRIRILKALGEVCDFIDFRKVYEDEFYGSLKKANELLKKVFYSEINYGSPKVVAIGHTHIDIAWLWTLSQTKEKAIRSFSTVLKLMEQYPEYKFMSSQPILYKFIKEENPEVFEKIKMRVKEGRWEVDGAMWLEADCNIPSGESLVRQILFGYKFFEEEFGVISKSLWLPDVFGYSAALPQILKRSGINYFMTTKLSWNQFNTIPNDTFMWKGLDGSEVFSYFVTTCDYKKEEDITFSGKNQRTTYTGILNANQTIGTFKRYQNKDINEDTLMLFGYGDGGGGPTKEMLENARRLKYGLPNCPRIEIGFEGEFFDNIYDKLKDDKDLPKWVGELYFEYHRGTYTSMAKNKWYNRKLEILYENIETLSTLNMILGEEYPQKEIDEGWDIILLNQFHDIIPGSSIRQVYEESHEQYEEILNKGRETLKDGINKLISKTKIDKKSIFVFNFESYLRDDIVEVELEDEFEVAYVFNSKKDIVKVQQCGNKILFYAKGIPAKGYQVYEIMEGKLESHNTFENLKRFENKFFKIEFDDDYNLASLFYKDCNREVIRNGERGNKFQAFEDRPINFENWDIDIFYKRKIYEDFHLESVELIESGPIRYCIKVVKSFVKSTIVQYIYFYNDIPRIDFKNEIEWNEQNILLKVNFPVDINSYRATYDIQFGNVERETHENTSWDMAKFETCGHKWTDLSEGDFGVSLLNDCKYGHDIKNGNMRITLLRAGTYPNEVADIGFHEFTYSIYPHAGTWKEAETHNMACNLNNPLYASYIERSEGELESSLSIANVDKDNCVIEVLKRSEDGQGIIVRIYEYKNKRTFVNLNFYYKVEEVWECDLMERMETRMVVKDKSLGFMIKPYEIKTFFLKI